MAYRNYRVRIHRGDQQFEAEGDKKFVLDILKRFESGSDVHLPPAPPRAGKAEKPIRLEGPAGKSLSPGEFVRQLGFKKHTDLVLALPGSRPLTLRQAPHPAPHPSLSSPPRRPRTQGHGSRRGRVKQQLRGVLSG